MSDANVTRYRCAACSLDLPRDSFSWGKTGRQAYCRACSKAKNKAYREANAAKLNEKQRRRRADNLEAHKARQANWYKRNAESARAAGKRWRDENPDKAALATGKWRANNPEKVREFALRRRAREMSAPGEHTADDIRDLFDLQKGRCTSCRAVLPKNYHVDHVEPLSKGGSNDRINLQLLCPGCNLQKSARDPLEFMRSKGFLL